MKKIIYTIVGGVLLMVAGCNKREYCDFWGWENVTRFQYDWSNAKGTIPEKLNNSLYSLKRDSIFISPNDKVDVYLSTANYSLFVWNDADNVVIKDSVIVVAKNADGSLKSVGELFTGKKNFAVMSIDLKEQERNNTHQWNDPPYHTGNKDLVKDVVIPMVAQTRVLKVYLKVNGSGMERVKNIKGVIKGIASSRRYNDTSEGFTDGVIDMTFDVVSGMYVGYVRVIGADEAVSQTVNLTVSFDDGTSGDLTANVTDEMKDFNDDLGGKDKEIVIDIVVKKTDVGLSATIEGWGEGYDGDNNTHL